MKGKYVLSFFSGFYELYRESVVTQSTVTLMVTITVCYMYLMGMSVPTELINVLMLILGFYFGGKTKTIKQ